MPRHDTQVTTVSVTAHDMYAAWCCPPRRDRTGRQARPRVRVRVTLPLTLTQGGPANASGAGARAFSCEKLPCASTTQSPAANRLGTDVRGRRKAP
jgi:hypothetical protein